MSTEKPKKRPLSPVRRQQNRREFIRTGVLAGGTLIAAMAGFVPIAGGGTHRLRPPGALKDAQLGERDFLSACIKCGQCVQVCPVEAIKLADLADGFGIGVPYIEARAQACDFSCDGLQCVLACPTGALTHDLNYPAETRMGFARLARPDACLAMQGKGFKGQARGPDFKGELRYREVDRWNPIPVADHPYDLELCDLCMRECPIEVRIAQCAAGSPPSSPENVAAANPSGHAALAASAAPRMESAAPSSPPSPGVTRDMFNELQLEVKHLRAELARIRQIVDELIS